MLEEDPKPEAIVEPEPEDFLPTPKKKGFLQQRPSVQSLNPALLFFLSFILMSFAYWTYDFRDQLWASKETVFVHKEYWRVFTSLFIHAHLMHLLNNSILFIIFASLLYFFYGALVFPLT